MISDLPGIETSHMPVSVQMRALSVLRRLGPVQIDPLTLPDVGPRDVSDVGEGCLRSPFGRPLILLGGRATWNIRAAVPLSG